METRQRRGHALKGGLWLVLVAVLLLRLPFLNQAIQGDDVYYLAGAEHAQIDPLHPNHVQYVFLGDKVDLRGHPHPPLDAWFLGLLLAAMGDIHEVPFHAAYILFSLIAAVSMWVLARRFSPEPLWATLLFLAVPAYVINGNSLESDLPLLAFWMAAVALFVSGRWAWCAICLVLASMAAYQAIFLTPILALYVWLYRRREPAAWAVALAPPLALGSWQIFERLSTGAVPAEVLNGYFQTYGFQAFARKVRSGLALSVHACWMVFPLLLPPAALAAWRKRREPDTLFLLGWIAIFFAGALAVFFAGSARYLLPMAAPVVLLVSRLPRRWLIAGFLLEMPLSLALAVVNYQHWDGYRQFAASMQHTLDGHRVWIDGEWGLRYYFEAQGGLPLEKGQPMRAGDVVVSSALSHPVDFMEPTTLLAQREIRPALPLRLIGLTARSGYSTAAMGLRPFDIDSGPIDRVRAELVTERHPTLSYLPMNAPECQVQLVSGVFSLEGTWRWTGAHAVILLKSPAHAAPLRAVFTIYEKSPARRVSLLLDGREVAAQTYAAPGAYTLESPPQMPGGPTATLEIEVDKTFSVPGDRRELGVILSSAGFAP